MCGASNVAEKYIMLWVTKIQREMLGIVRKNVACVVEEKKGCVSRHPDRRSCEAHFFGEQYQEADHLANLGGGRSLWRKETTQKTGMRCADSGTAAKRQMVEVDVEL